MKKNLLLLLLSLLIIGCCPKDPIETARYALAEEELALVPYQTGEKIRFIHSGGYSFDFEVIEDSVYWKEYHEFCEWNCCSPEYISYQVRKTVLESDYPEFRIEIELGEAEYSYFNPRIMNLNINYRHFAYITIDSTGAFIPGENAELYDTFLLAGKTYTNVIKKPFDFHYFMEDSSGIFKPESILYSPDAGLLQILMTNDETYTIDK
ncbi:MAG: hypothetical protein JW801_10570 [Bacteroidales bacterium]|nr:hypothetical protein [Bacteroidales bacterium]